MEKVAYEDFVTYRPTVQGWLDRWLNEKDDDAYNKLMQREGMTLKTYERGKPETLFSRKEEKRAKAKAKRCARGTKEHNG